MEYFTRSYALALWIIMSVMPLGLAAQRAVMITVSDSAAASPLPDAVVRIAPLSKASKDKGNIILADRKGIVEFNYTEPVAIHISYLGYVSISDTIRAVRAINYRLHKTTSNIDDVVVTGLYAPGSKTESLYNITVYTEKDFREKGATNLREVLEGSLDIDLSQDPVFGSGVSLQGISGEGVKILVDGVPLVGRSSGILDISQVLLGNIERVEVIKGPMSVIYGSDAMGGVINLITKTSQGEKINLDLKGYYESVGQYNAILSGGLNLGKSQLFFSGGRNFFGGYSAVDTSRHKDWAPKEQYFGNMKYVYNAAKFRLGFSMSIMRELLIDRGDLQANTDYATDLHYLTFRPEGTLFATVPIKDYSKLDLLLAYSGYVQYIDYYQKNLVTLADNLLQDQSENDTSVYHDIVARAVYTLTSRNKIVSFQFGADIDQEYTHQTLIAGLNQSMGDYAVFGSGLFKPLPGLEIQPGLRFSYNTRYNTPLIPNLNVRYSFARHFAIRASYGLGYRAPSLQELYLSFHDSNHNLNGNPNLKPEEGNCASLALDFHYEFNKQRFKLSNTGFFNKIENKIDFVLTDASTTPVTYQYFNINNYMTAGGEHLFEYGWKRVTVDAGVNYMLYRVSLGGGVAPQQMFSPDATLRVGYTIPKAEIGVSVWYKYTGKKPLYSVFGGNANEYGYTYSFNTINFSLTRNFWKNRIQLTCGAKNLLNITNVATNGVIPFGHDTDPNSAMMFWGRTYFVSLNLHLAK
jgi:outer membrane receptor for ferrienterochelin and colicins